MMRDFARSIVETVRQPLLIIDEHMRTVSANAHFYQTFQTTAAETLDQPFFALQGGRWDNAQLQARMAATLAEGGFTDFEVQHDIPHLGRRILLLNGRRVTREGERAPMILLAIEDATAARSVQAELELRVRERTAELAAANRELEAFCYSVSHDLRAPLRAIDGFSDELLRSYLDRLDSKGQHYLQRIRSGTQRMGQLIDDLLQLSRFSRSPLQRERVDLSALAAGVVAELQHLETGRAVACAIEPNLTAFGDARLLRVVLMNLLGNAWKFTGRQAQPAIQVGLGVHEGRPAFFVRDNGAGFDMAHAGKLFGAFQRLHSERDFPGTGVGLATVQRIIHRHGGRVWADSQPGAGTTFYFNLPGEPTP